MDDPESENFSFVSLMLEVPHAAVMTVELNTLDTMVKYFSDKGKTNMEFNMVRQFMLDNLEVKLHCCLIFHN